MAFPLTAPCVNINDETVLVIDIKPAIGDFVKKGDIVGAVETDKAVVDVEAEKDGYVIGIPAKVDEKAKVGSVLVWFGESADEKVPEVIAVPAGGERGAIGRPTAKAAVLLKKHGVSAESVPASGERLTVSDVEDYLAKLGEGKPVTGTVAVRATESVPDVPGELRDPTPEEAGMLHTVAWHRDHAAATYLEVEYDPAPWEAYADAYAKANKLMLSPLLSLLAWRLAEIVRDTPKLNATVVNGRRYQYSPVNLGFTVQAGATLYLTVVRDADKMDAAGFIGALGEVQRHAIAKKLRPEEVSGATVAFSSMARWMVSRHIPILPPYCSLMIAHAAPKGSGRAVLGASYDHRVLSGFDVARLLTQLSQPPQ